MPTAWPRIPSSPVIARHQAAACQLLQVIQATAVTAAITPKHPAVVIAPPVRGIIVVKPAHHAVIDLVLLVLLTICCHRSSRANGGSLSPSLLATAARLPAILCRHCLLYSLQTDR